MSYSGKYRPKNINKYAGDPTAIKYRSLWERQVFRFLDENENIEKWSSEETVIPYRCKTDNKMHRYFVDVKFKTRSDGKVHLIEIKPKKETMPPVKNGKNTSRRFLNEVMTYTKNISKWEAAEQYALDRGWEFSIWTEDSLKSLGIRLL